MGSQVLLLLLLIVLVGLLLLRHSSLALSFFVFSQRCHFTLGVSSFVYSGLLEVFQRVGFVKLKCAGLAHCSVLLKLRVAFVFCFLCCDVELLSKGVVYMVPLISDLGQWLREVECRRTISVVGQTAALSR